MKKILAFLLVSVLMVGLFLTGCAPQATLQEGEATKAPAAPADTATAPKEPTTEASVEPIKIGALLDYTGVVAELGPKYEAGIRLAIDDFGGQVAGRPIELITADSGSDVTKAVEKFKDITEKDGVKIVIGPLMGDAHVAIAPLAKEKDVIITSLVNGIYDTIETSGRHYVIYPTTVEAQTYPLGGYAYNELGYKTAATIGSNFAGKIGFVEGFVQGFTEAGGTITQQVWSEPGADDFSGYITSLPKDVDCILYALNGPAEVSKFVYQVRQAGFKVPLLTITQDAD